jgi:Ca-activated chloride channel family protein
LNTGFTQGGICILNRFNYENSRHEGIGLLELIREDANSEESQTFAPLKKSALTGDITGPLATLCLTQTYAYTKEQCEKVLEARYRFPLPGDSAVTGVRVTFGDTEIRTVLKDRQTAKDDYKEAKKEGKQAVMVTRESPDVFTICVAGIQPGEDVRIATSYVQVARPEGAGWSLRVPLTTVPRYVRKDEFSSRHAQGQPLAVLRDPGHRFTLDVLVNNAASAESSTHRLAVSTEPKGLRITLQQGEVVPDRDFVMAWMLPQEAVRPTMMATVFRDGADAYFLALITPPASENVKKAPRECIILVDHSGSMIGTKWEASDWAVEKFLRGLDQGDRFALGVFHDTTRWFDRRLKDATTDNIGRAVDFLHANKEEGGTELGVAIEQALDIGRSEGDVSRHVLIVTDAEVSDEGRILRLVKNESKRADRRRISILCIDAAPNSFLASQIAEKGGGVARFLTSSPEEGDISTALDAILESWEQPVFANCRLAVSGTGVEAVEHSFVGYDNRGYIDLGDITAKRANWVSGQTTTDEPVELKLLDSSGREMMACTGEPVENAAIRSLTGARKIAGLEFLIHSGLMGDELREELKSIGYKPETVFSGKQSKLYPENNQVKETEALRSLIVTESIRYGIASSETAFIAVSEKAGKKVEETIVVANALAEGWSDQFITPCKSCGKPAPSMDRTPYEATSQEPAVSQTESDDVSGIIDKSIHDPMKPAQKHVKRVARISGLTTVFEGMPAFTGGEAVLYDSAHGGRALAGISHLRQLKVEFPDGIPEEIASLKVLIFVDDMAVPRAAVRLSDLAKQGGVRPLNMIVTPGVSIRIVLAGKTQLSAAMQKRIKVLLNVW